jgi:hypothetical protein
MPPERVAFGRPKATLPPAHVPNMGNLFDFSEMF